MHRVREVWDPLGRLQNLGSTLFPLSTFPSSQTTISSSSGFSGEGCPISKRWACITVSWCLSVCCYVLTSFHRRQEHEASPPRSGKLPFSAASQDHFMVILTQSIVRVHITMTTFIVTLFTSPAKYISFMTWLFRSFEARANHGLSCLVFESAHP